MAGGLAVPSEARDFLPRERNHIARRTRCQVTDDRRFDVNAGFQYKFRTQLTTETIKNSEKTAALSQKISVPSYVGSHRGAGKFRHGGVAGGGDILARENLDNSEDENLEIKPEGVVVHVPDV